MFRTAMLIALSSGLNAGACEARADNIAPPTEAKAEAEANVDAPTEVEPTKTVVAAPQQRDGSPKLLEIVEGRAFLDPVTNFVKIAGEVRNNSPHWVVSPRIDVELFDADGNKLSVSSIAVAAAADAGRPNADDAARAERVYVPPGGTAVFQYLRDAKKIGGTYASHRLSVSAHKADAPPEVKLDGFAITRLTEEFGPDFRAEGKLSNTGSVGCRSPRVVLGFYDDAGKILHAKLALLHDHFAKTLEPSQSIDVSLEKIYAPRDTEVARVEAWADCART